jgi:hypothetical protein
VALSLWIEIGMLAGCFVIQMEPGTHIIEVDGLYWCPHFDVSVGGGAGGMASRLAGKRAIVVTDHELLFRAIELNLHYRLGIEIVTPTWSVADCQDMEEGVVDVDLIVVALSSPISEPVVALTERSLAGWIGKIPLLVISDKLFDPGPIGEAIHLNFPFTPDGLRDRIKEMLHDVGGPEEVMQG